MKRKYMFFPFCYRYSGPSIILCSITTLLFKGDNVVFGIYSDPILYLDAVTKKAYVCYRVYDIANVNARLARNFTGSLPWRHPRLYLSQGLKVKRRLEKNQMREKEKQEKGKPSQSCDSTTVHGSRPNSWKDGRQNYQSKTSNLGPKKALGQKEKERIIIQ